MPRLVLYMLIMLWILSSGCSQMPKYTVPEMSGPQDSVQQVADELRTMYPPSYRMAQRIVIKAFDREFDFVAYLLVVRGAVLRVQFLGEMGGTVMDLGMEGNKGIIFKKPDIIPDDRLVHGALGDMVFLFDPYADEEAYLVSNGSSSSVLVASPANHVFFEYSFNTGNNTPNHWRDIRDGRLVREARTGQYDVVKGGWNRSIPTRIELVNHEYNYTVDVQVLALKPGTGQSEQAP